MIRLAVETDVPQIAQGLLNLVPITGWACYQHGVTYDAVCAFVTSKLYDSKSVLYVEDDDSKVVSFCGGSLACLHVPPYHTTVYEWGWYGGRRGAAMVWQAVKRWGKRHGAKLAGYIIAKPGNSATTIHEHTVWKVL